MPRVSAVNGHASTTTSAAYVTSLVGDSGGPVATGTYGGLTATTNAASKAVEWELVLAPAS